MDYWDSEEDRPRVMTYVRKKSRLGITLRRPVVSRDLLWLEINGYSILNYYRAPGDATVVDFLTELDPPPNCLAMGDANAKHPDWEPGVISRDGGGRLAEWATRTGMSFIGEPGVPTHVSGHVIDLPFSNIPFLEARRDTATISGSDHYPIRIPFTSVGTTPTQGDTRPRIADADLERVGDLAALAAQALPKHIPHTPEGVEEAARALSAKLVDILTTLGRTKRTDGKAAPWWTAECETARRTWRGAVPPEDDLGEATPERRAFLATVRRAKREYWRKRIDDTNTDQKLYEVVGWCRKGPTLNAPPLQDGPDTPLIEDGPAKAKFLHQKILNRFTAEDDLPENEGIPEGPGTLPWDTSVPPEELKHHMCAVAATSPGTDGVTTRLLKAAWPHIQDHCCRLGEAILQTAYFPTLWKEGLVTMIPKIGKSDMSTFRSYRPIALLSCIGKGYERLLAKRMAWTALQHNLVSPTHAGALPRRSATDLAVSLTHDVETALARGKKVTMVTLDVQGAFDALLRRRLTKRMHDQGWPPIAIRLVDSFLTNREVRSKLEEHTSPPTTQQCGTPQGSPWSPILYMLYLAELVKMGTCRYGYADDIALIAIGRDLEESTKKASDEVNRILAYGEANKICFAPEKMEAIHFSRSRDSPNPDIPTEAGLVTPVPLREAIGVDENGDTSWGPSSPALRWLGIWFDRRLTFKRHVERRVAATIKIANHIKSLGRVSRGPPADALHKAVTTIVIPSLLYGSEVWYKGRTKPNARNRTNRPTETSTRLGSHIDSIQRALVKSARGILPVWKTQPNASLFADAGLPTAELALEEARYRLAVRLRTIHEGHPLALRSQRTVAQRGRTVGQPTKICSNIQLTLGLLPEVERVTLYPPRYGAGSRDNPTRGLSKEEATTEFNDWFQTMNPWDVTVFSDGSMTKDGVGYGYVVYSGQTKETEGKGGLSTFATVFDAEALGALRGLEAATTLFPGLPITLCADNTATLWCIQKDAPATSHSVFTKIHSIMKDTPVTIKWSPGHQDIAGNEAADALAKDGAAGDLDPAARDTASGIKSIARKRIKTAAISWWTNKPPKLNKKGEDVGTVRPVGHVDAHVSYRPGKCPPALKLPRPYLNKYLATLSGHGDYMWYHKKFGHTDAEMHCACHCAKAPTHLVHCRTTQELIDEWPAPPKPLKPNGEPFEYNSWAQRLHEKRFWTRGHFEGYWVWLIQNPSEFEKFCKATEYFERAAIPFGPQSDCCIPQEDEWDAQSQAESDTSLEIIVPGHLSQSI